DRPEARKQSPHGLRSAQPAPKTRRAQRSVVFSRNAPSPRTSRKYNAPRGRKDVQGGGSRMQGVATYNAAADLIDRNLAARRGPKPAFIDDRGCYSYAELAERVSRFANVVRRLGIHPEQRILVSLHDTIAFPTAFLGAIKAGVVPVAVNTQLSPAEF